MWLPTTGTSRPEIGRDVWSLPDGSFSPWSYLTPSLATSRYQKTTVHAAPDHPAPSRVPQRGGELTRRVAVVDDLKHPSNPDECRHEALDALVDGRLLTFGRDESQPNVPYAPMWACPPGTPNVWLAVTFTFRSISWWRCKPQLMRWRLIEASCDVLHPERSSCPNLNGSPSARSRFSPSSSADCRTARLRTAFT